MILHPVLSSKKILSMKENHASLDDENLEDDDEQTSSEYISKHHSVKAECRKQKINEFQDCNASLRDRHTKNKQRASPLPFSHFTEDDKMRLALRSSYAMRPGAFCEHGGGMTKPTRQDELWKQAMFNRHNERHHDEEDARCQRVDRGHMSTLDELVGMQQGQNNMHDLQDIFSRDEHESEIPKRLKWKKYLVLGMIMIIALVLIFIFLTLGSNIFKGKQINAGNNLDTMSDYTLFDYDSCYDPNISVDKKDHYDAIRTIVLSNFMSMDESIDKAYSKESLALCWLTYFDKFTGDGEKEIIQRYILAIIFFHFREFSQDKLYIIDGLLKLGWLTSNSSCKWQLVQCSNKTYSDGAIIGLEISEMKLKGQLPQELALLSDLTSLRILTNLLTGNIPEEIWKLTKLKELSILHNSFNGPFPNSITSLRALTHLTLNTMFSGTIPDINQLSNLEYLSISSVSLRGKFPSVERLNKLDTFILNSDLIEGKIESHLWRMPKLRIFQASIGSSFLFEFTNYSTNLEMIDIEGSTDGNLSTEIGHLSKLKSFALKSTLVKGSIPSELGRLSNLESLILQGNPLMTGTIPTEICQVTNLDIELDDTMKVKCKCCNETTLEVP